MEKIEDKRKTASLFLGMPHILVPFHSGQMVIDFCSQKKDADAEIEPQHQNSDTGKTSIHGGKS